MLRNETIKVLRQQWRNLNNNFGLVKAFLITTSNLETIKERNQHIYLHKKKNHGAQQKLPAESWRNLNNENKGKKKHKLSCSHLLILAIINSCLILFILKLIFAVISSHPHNTCVYMFVYIYICTICMFIKKAFKKHLNKKLSVSLNIHDYIYMSRKMNLSCSITHILHKPI